MDTEIVQKKENLIMKAELQNVMHYSTDVWNIRGGLDAECSHCTTCLYCCL